MNKLHLSTRGRLGPLLTAGLALLGGCGQAPPVDERPAALGGPRDDDARRPAAPTESGLLLRRDDGAAEPPLGVIVRLRERPTFEIYAAERARGRSRQSAAAAAGRHRARLSAQQERVRKVLEERLGPLRPRGGPGVTVGGLAYEGFHDVLNGLAIHGLGLADARRLLEADRDVLSTEPIVRVQAALLDSIPQIDADDLWAHQDANGVALDGTGLRIGVIDTGVDYTHPDLGGCFGAGCKVSGGYDFVNHDGDPRDDNGHGTHVAATAAGSGTYGGGALPIRGAAPGAQLYAYKVLAANGYGSNTDVVSAIGRCADPNSDGDPSDHLDVCNLSLGVTGGSPDDAASLALDSVTALGVVFTVAAGNTGPGASTINSPGTARTAITVAAACKPGAIGASPCTQAVASFSSRGPVLWTVGGAQQSLAKPDVAAPGVSVCAAEWGTFQSGSRCLDSRHVSLSGTSIASAQVAGVAALLRQAHPEWTPAQVKDVLRGGARTLGLDSSTQGAGLINAMDSASLGGLPTSVARLSGPPLIDVDYPTARFATFTSDLTISNPTAEALTYAPSFSGDAGLSATFAPASLTLAPGATGALTITRQADHSVAASGAELRGTVTLATARGDAQVGVRVGVRDRLSATPAQVDLGVDLASLPSWTGQATLQLQNALTDQPATYSASITCCSSGTQPGGGAISATLSAASVTLGPGGSAPLTVTVSATNGGLINARFNGTLELTSPLQRLSIPVTFFKGYGLQVTLPPPLPSQLVLSSALAGSTTLAPAASPVAFYSTQPGPFFAEAVWPGDSAPYVSHHVLAGDLQTDVPVRAVSLEKSQAVYTLELRPTDQNGAGPSSATVVYRVTHAATGGGVPVAKIISPGTVFKARLSAVPAGFTFTAAVAGRSPDPIGFLYEVPGAIASDLTLTNSAAQLTTRELRSFRRASGSNATYFMPWACLIAPYSVSATGAMAGGGSLCYSNNGAAVALDAAGAGRMRFFNWASRDLSALPYPDAPAIGYELRDGSASGAVLGKGPNLYVSAARTQSFRDVVPFASTIRPSEAYATFGCEEPPGTTLALGPAPLVDQWGWYNHRTDMFDLRGREATPTHGWGGCVIEPQSSPNQASYRLYRDNQLVSSGSISPYLLELRMVGASGAHRLELTRSGGAGGLTTQSETVSTFQLSASASLDENPPRLRRLHLVGRGQWQGVVDPAIVNRVEFTVDPVPGFDQWSAAPPPQFTSLADALSSVTLQESSDGSAWTPVPTQALGEGRYRSGELLVDGAAPLLWLRILATDSAGNSFRYTFQVPRGSAYAAPGEDTQAPTTALLAPAPGATVSATVVVSATAADDVAVSRVDLYVDGQLSGTMNGSSHYSLPLDTWSLVNGAHTLQTRAYDTAENVGVSAPISITVENRDTVAPVVTMTAPAAGALLSGVTTLSAMATDNVAVARVEFSVDGTLVGTATAAPYAVQWDAGAAANGAHSLQARAFDLSGNEGASAPVAVVVDHQAPTVALTAPANGATVSGPVTVSATATDNTTVARVEFYLDGAVLLGSDSSAPYQVTWVTAPAQQGPHTLTARAYDGAGNVATSAARSVTVADVTAPTVAITSPAEGARVTRGSTVTITATAADAGGIAQVSFYVGTRLTCTDTTSPYSCAWTVPGGATRAYQLQARATDNAGLTTASTIVNVTSR